MMNNGGPQQPPMSPEDMDKMMKMKALQKLQMGQMPVPQPGQPMPGQQPAPQGMPVGQPPAAPAPQGMPPQPDPSAQQPTDLGTDLSQQEESARLMAIRKKLFPNSVPQQ